MTAERGYLHMCGYNINTHSHYIVLSGLNQTPQHIELEFDAFSVKVDIPK